MNAEKTTKRTYVKRTDKEKTAVDSIRMLVKRIDELEAENRKLKSDYEKLKKEYEEYDESCGAEMSRLEYQRILLKSLVNIPDNLKDMVRELLIARFAYWENIFGEPYNSESYEKNEIIQTFLK